MRTTRYFVEQVLRKRPEIDPDLCLRVLANPLRRTVQPDGRIRFWGEVHRAEEISTRYIRVVTLSDGATIHNAFFDRGFRRDEMKLHYYPETDSLYIEFKAAPSAETREISDGVNVDLDQAGDVVGFDIDQASKRLDLSTLETLELPFRATKAA